MICIAWWRLKRTENQMKNQMNNQVEVNLRTSKQGIKEAFGIYLLPNYDREKLPLNNLEIILTL